MGRLRVGIFSILVCCSLNFKIYSSFIYRVYVRLRRIKRLEECSMHYEVTISYQREIETFHASVFHRLLALNLWPRSILVETSVMCHHKRHWGVGRCNQTKGSF